MNELLKQRILRRLEALSDERGYQILDYVEFIESKYAQRGAAGGFFSKLTETAEDTMRAVGLPIKAVSGTMGLMESAGKVMKGVAAAAQSVVDEAVKAAGTGSSTPAPPKPAGPPTEGSEPRKPA
jgi:hypothetical protein